MTPNPTTAKICLDNRIIYLQRQRRLELLSLEEYEVLVAQARIDHTRLEQIENAEKVQVRLSFGIRPVYVTGLLTDEQLTPLVEFKMSKRETASRFHVNLKDVLV